VEHVYTVYKQFLQFKPVRGTRLHRLQAVSKVQPGRETRLHHLQARFRGSLLVVEHVYTAYKQFLTFSSARGTRLHRLQAVLEVQTWSWNTSTPSTSSF
jgi:hypothetical protein